MAVELTDSTSASLCDSAALAIRLTGGQGPVYSETTRSSTLCADLTAQRTQPMIPGFSVKVAAPGRSALCLCVPISELLALGAVVEALEYGHGSEAPSNEAGRRTTGAARARVEGGTLAEESLPARNKRSWASYGRITSISRRGTASALPEHSWMHRSTGIGE